MDTDELRTGLSEAGLSSYQIDAYVTLLNLGSASATSLAEKADVPRSRIYDVLRDLEEDGYVETYKQDSLRVRASEPSKVFQELQSRAETLSNTATEIRNRWQQPGVGSHRISVLKRVETVIERAEESIRDTTNQVHISVTPDQYYELAPALQACHENGVFVSVSFNTTHEEPTELPSDEELDGIVTEARHRHLPAPFLVLADREIACFAPHKKLAQYGAVFEDETLAYVFHWYFEAALWESWPLIYTSHDDSLPAEYVNIRRCIRDIAPLLSDGATIHATARGRKIGLKQTQTLSGEITDILYATGDHYEQDQIPSLSSLAGQATIVLRTDDGKFGVGGWGAVLEDLEADRIIIESVSYPNDGGDE
ncbi:TrmB family transcriptional regulator [Haladaptatus caseinilyticus]|uniref:TrmB family transcriptional regulator n=1 Tax=Haladaptatus caseinilyticus TaxID=2993314 RepID=UPI00224AF3A6|nr:TrmB family transcriptional regulator [Haladaptatus caseinilyticus]